jgi:hypothetical protein
METFEAAEREPLPPERIAGEVLELQHHVRLIEAPVPADLCHGWQSFEPCAEEITRIAVWRGVKGAHLVRLDPAEFVLLQRLQQGATLDGLFSAPLDPEPLAEDVQRWFSGWQARGWITARGSEVIELVPQDDDWSGVDKMGSQARAMED